MSDQGFKGLFDKDAAVPTGGPDRVRDFEWVDLEVKKRPRGGGESEDSIFTPLRSTEEFKDPWEKAKARARKLVAEAEAKAQQVQDKAHEGGYAAGQEEGRAMVSARVEAALANLEQVIKKLENERSQIFDSMEGDLVAVVLAAVDRVLMTEGAANPAVVQNVVRACVDRVKEAAKIVVKVASADLQAIAQLKPEFMANLGELSTVSIEMDPKLKPGDVVVDSNLAKVDATMATRRALVEEAVGEAMLDSPGVPPIAGGE